VVHHQGDKNSGEHRTKREEDPLRFLSCTTQRESDKCSYERYQSSVGQPTESALVPVAPRREPAASLSVGIRDGARGLLC
jgi:hypothetical protein